MLSALKSCLDIIKSIDDMRQKHLEDLKKILKDWDELYTNVSENNLASLRQNQITLPFPSRLHGLLKIPYIETIMQFLKILEFVCTENLDEIQKLTKSVDNNLSKLVLFISDVIHRQNSSKDSYWGRREALEYVVNVHEVYKNILCFPWNLFYVIFFKPLQVFCISILICVISFQIAKPTQSKKTKKKPDNKVRECLIKLSTLLIDEVKKLDSLLESWRVLDERDLSDELSALNLNTEGQSSVLKHLKNSHIIAVEDLRTIFKGKVKFLDSFIH